MNNIFEKIKEKLEYARINCVPKINGRDCTVEELNIYNMAFTYAKKLVSEGNFLYRKLYRCSVEPEDVEDGCLPNILAEKPEWCPLILL